MTLTNDQIYLSFRFFTLVRTTALNIHYIIKRLYIIKSRKLYSQIHFSINNTSTVLPHIAVFLPLSNFIIYPKLQQLAQQPFFKLLFTILSTKCSLFKLLTTNSKLYLDVHGSAMCASSARKVKTCEANIGSFLK